MWRSWLQINIDAPNFSGYAWDLESTKEFVQTSFRNNMDDTFFDSLFYEDGYKSGSECRKTDNDAWKYAKNIHHSFCIKYYV